MDDGPRDALRELRLALGIELAELEAAEQPAAAIGELREVLAEAPLHEPAHRALMRLLAGAGRRQEALAQFQELERGLRREFEDEPDDETRALYREILTRGFGPESEQAPAPAAPEPDAEHPGRLPRQLTSFVGRERELAETTALLRGSRLLTLTGAGGCGKTRLALELARQRGEELAGETRVVELAAVTDAELTGPAVALQHFGGAVARVGSGDTAYAERQAPFVLNVIAVSHDESEFGPHVDWAQQAYAAFGPALTGAAYINFLSAEGDERVRAASGADNFARLQALKDRYDPTNLFHRNQNVPPSS